MIYGRNVDKETMNFDQIGKQHVSRRRRPSPLRNPKYSPSSFDTRFSQQVWPRPKNADSTESRNLPPRQRQTRSSTGFSIPMSWLKNLAIGAGIMVIGIVGTNWDSIAGSIGARGIPVKTLQDTAAYEIMEARYEPLLPYGGQSSEETPGETPKETPQEIPLDLTETFSWTEYQIREGDTITGIALRYSVSSGSIIAFNNIQEAWNIRAGNVLKIPNMDGIPYTVKKNDNLSKIAAKMNVPQNAILDANNMLSDTIRPGEVLFLPGARMDANEFNQVFRRDAVRKTAEKPVLLPVGGKVTSGYGWREDPVNPKPGEKRFHRGVDFIGKTGDPIKAAMKGTVLHMDNNPNLGNFIIIKHDNGYQTLYAHLSAYSVKAGEMVEQGQEIGKVGDTGYTTGPHLHFEAFRNGNRINPLDLFK
jgi:murein DD-endopeptidase MepM/ murein hydrolase activator NlpD